MTSFRRISAIVSVGLVVWVFEGIKYSEEGIFWSKTASGWNLAEVDLDSWMVDVEGFRGGGRMIDRIDCCRLVVVVISLLLGA